MKIFTCIEVEVRVCVCACVRWPVCVLFTINRCPSCRMWAKYSNIVRFNNITFQVVGTHSDVRSLTHTHKHTHNMHTCIRSEFILLMRSDVFLLTWQLFLLPWGDWRQSLHLLPWKREGSIYSTCLLSGIIVFCWNLAPHNYECTPAPVPGYHVYVVVVEPTKLNIQSHLGHFKILHWSINVCVNT